MNAKQFQRFIDRDGGCVHCGATEAIVPHHRANRGMGGSKIRDVPSNIVVMCSAMNLAMESVQSAADQALAAGWKLQSWESPSAVPFWHATRGEWFILDDDLNCEPSLFKR